MGTGYGVALFHDVLLERDALYKGADDAEVAEAVEVGGRVLVTHDRDFRAMGARVGVARRRLQRIDRLRLECAEAAAPERVAAALTLIKHEWSVARARAGEPMVVSLGRNIIRSHR